MLKLNLLKEPHWLDLASNVRVRVKPLTNAIMSAAQNIAIKEAIRLRDAGNLSENEATKFGISESMFIKALARYSIIEWDGVLTSDGTKAAEITDTNIDKLMDIWFIAQDFWQKYTHSLAMMVAEGKSLRPLPNGTMAAGQNIVEDATSKNCHAVKAKKTR